MKKLDTSLHLEMRGTNSSFNGYIVRAKELFSAATAHQTAAESAELDNNQSSGALHANGWKNSANVESYNGWSPSVEQAHSEPTGKQSHHVQTVGDHSGWVDARTKIDNNWAVPDSRATGKQSHHVQNLMDPPPLVATSGFNASISSAPFAPPIPEDVLGEEPIQYPSIDFNSVDMPIPATIGYGASTTNDAKEGDGSSSCIICWESPIEGACIPCGDMAGCMSCLSKIKVKKGLCPVCRGKIDQVIRLYAV
ncbi:hypothetical protein CRYUN_Cryun14cG0114900 [Craigia yunnanensis]